MKKRKYFITSSLIAASLFTISPALAATTAQATSSRPYVGGAGFPRGGVRKNGGGGAVGTVSAVSGSIVTLAGKNGTTYTVDVTNAKITKAKSVILASSIAVGDTLFVDGTVNGTSIAAKIVMDGVFGPMNGIVHSGKKANSTIGVISSINGSSFTIASRERFHASSTPSVATTTFTVNTTSATTFKKGGQAATLSDLVVGQYAVVMGPEDTAADTIAATGVNILNGTSTRPFNKRTKTAK